MYLKYSCKLEGGEKLIFMCNVRKGEINQIFCENSCKRECARSSAIRTIEKCYEQKFSYKYYRKILRVEELSFDFIRKIEWG